MSSEFTRSSTVAEILPGSDVESEADLKILQFNVGRATQKQINFAGINCRVILFIMSTATAKLLSEFEALPVEQQQEFLREVMNHPPPWDSGPLSDDAVATAGDALAAMLHQEERAS